jgi:hypothetical protein
MLLFAAPALAAPANDDFANAAIVPSALPETIGGTTVDATTEPAEPDHGVPGPNASVWYAWIPGADVRAKIELCESGSEPSEVEVAVYTGTSVGSLTRVADSFRGCRLFFDAMQDQPYMIAVDPVSSLADGEGPFQLLLRALAPPPNDDLANAQDIPLAPDQTVDGSTVDATTEPAEPTHGSSHAGPEPGSAGSVWYEWTSDSNGGTASFDVCGSFSPYEAVYTGNAYGALSWATANFIADYGKCSQSIAAAPLTTYRIAVESHYEGSFDLAVTYQANDPPPIGSSRPPPAATVPAGQVAAAVKKCTKAKAKHRKRHKSCKRHAKRRPTERAKLPIERMVAIG